MTMKCNLKKEEMNMVMKSVKVKKYQMNKNLKKTMKKRNQ